MDQLTPRVLNHFCLFSFTDPYWMLNQNARATFHEQWLRSLGVAATNFDVYQNADSRGDMLVWCALNAPEPSTASSFFAKYAALTTPFRHLVTPVDSMWAFTQPTPDAKARSTQDIDPLSSTRLQYLLVHPFGSGPEWYGMTPESRRAVIQERIHIADQYDDVKQLVLYSFGLQEHEIILVYETDDLGRFAELTTQLRDQEAGRFVPRGAWGYTAIYHPMAETLGLWK